MGTIPSVVQWTHKVDFKEGSVVLIQGASSGLGWQLALKYAERQCPVVVSARNEKKLKELVQLCESKFGNKNVIYKVAEATKVDECKALVEFTVEKFGRLDILVLAAGIAAHSLFKDLESAEILRELMDVNYMGYVNLTMSAIADLRRSQG